MSGRGQRWSEGSQLFILKLISVICSTDWLYSLQSLFKSCLVDLSSQLPGFVLLSSHCVRFPLSPPESLLYQGSPPGPGGAGGEGGGGSADGHVSSVPGSERVRGSADLQ